MQRTENKTDLNYSGNFRKERNLSSGDVCYCLILVEAGKWQQILVKIHT
jgi:hypothetical protein